MEWLIGCSGFYNKHWKGVFYPEKLAQAKWFEYYGTKLESLELNTSFYNFPTKERLTQWYKRSPEGFILTVKAPRLITHYKKFNECDRLLNDFYTSCRDGLKEKCGCLLFQMPPNFGYNEENLTRVIKSMQPGFENVVEFREADWWNETVFKVLADHDIIFSSISHPSLPNAIVANTDVAYMRMHGKPKLYQSGYSMEDLQKLYKQIRTQGKIKKAYIYFNNTDSIDGILNALEMKEIVAEEPSS
jgi:uncharacterized protein YecE (DUF72 family)